MAKLDKEQLEKECESYGFILKDCSNYKNIHSLITLSCNKGHSFDTTIAQLRKGIVKCPECEYESTANFNVNIKEVPLKVGQRLIAFDQASKTTGISIYDDNKLVYFTAIHITGDLDNRLHKFYFYLTNFIIPELKPDYLVFEDIQLQTQVNNVLTFKTLAMILGLCKLAAFDNGIPYMIVGNNVWQSYFGIEGKNRAEQKNNVIQRVEDFYKVRITDDVADAILIGRYATTKIPNQNKISF